MKPTTRDALQAVLGRFLIAVVALASLIVTAVGLGLAVGVFWRAVRWVNGW